MEKHENMVLKGLNFPAFYKRGNNINMQTMKEFIGFSNDEFSNMIQRSKQQVNKIINNVSYNPNNVKIQNLLKDLIKIYTLVVYTIDSSKYKNDEESLKEIVINWFRLPNPAYRGKSPMELIIQGNSYEVIKSLENYLYGVPS